MVDGHSIGFFYCWVPESKVKRILLKWENDCFETQSS